MVLCYVILPSPTSCSSLRSVNKVPKQPGQRQQFGSTGTTAPARQQLGQVDLLGPGSPLPPPHAFQLVLALPRRHGPNSNTRPQALSSASHWIRGKSIPTRGPPSLTDPLPSPSCNTATTPPGSPSPPSAGRLSRPHPFLYFPESPPIIQAKSARSSCRSR